MSIDGTSASKFTIDGVNMHPGFKTGSQFIPPDITTFGNLTLKNLKLTKMRRGRGGAIAHETSSGSLLLDNVDVSASRATNTTIDGGGGAIFGKGAMTVRNSQFTSNSAASTTAGNGGGAILIEYATSSANPSAMSVSISNSTFSSNSLTGANAQGGAIQADRHNLALSITNSAFENNTSLSDGGAIYFARGAHTVNKATFVGNSAVNGGALRMGGIGALTVNNSTFNNNTASNFGGAFCCNDSTLRHISASGNTANNGGGIYLSDSSVNLHNSIIYGNTATGTGANH